jgi:hypothetical protein
MPQMLRFDPARRDRRRMEGSLDGLVDGFFGGNPLICRHLEGSDGLSEHSPTTYMCGRACARMRARTREAFIHIDPSNPSIFKFEIEIIQTAKDLSDRKRNTRSIQNASTSHPRPLHSLMRGCR